MTPGQNHPNRVKDVNKRDIRSMVKRAINNKSNGLSGNGSSKYVHPQTKKRKWKIKVKRTDE